MTRSTKKATRKKDALPEQPAEEAAVTQAKAPKALRRTAQTPARRVPVQYTPRIPGARCPGC